MIRNTQPWAMTRQAKHAEGGHRHKLRETWKNVPESTMKEVSKAAGLYQSLPQGDSYNTVVGCWFVQMTLSGHRNEFPFAAAPGVQQRSLICPESTSQTSRSGNTSLPLKPAATSTIRCSKPAKLHKAR